ncbi:unnamed protein product [Aphanomyces euteiches]|uniref:Glutamine cyclotransferase n=1 Tax=Aphanomyces euteiches TaxID=100861 RepID=A0A6G0X9J9_9STRA|nr:hypothetical protein Ae201684_007125 [Aphanomyces euteiches]KAH9052434.1 hypothetical protein Ae201684P_001615 [Aphanomyces euteiches]KAH9154552.1 hypothetical protein AeRB84_003366 [Aphanomyces euteiches]
MVRSCLTVLAIFLSFPASNAANVDALEINPLSPTHGQYDLISVLPHNPEFFTEGLLFHNGMMLESTGLEGASYVREIGPEMNITKEFTFPSGLFGEGITVLNNKIYALTYKAKTGFVLDRDTFDLIDKFNFETTTGEGWGMTTDGHSLIVSDGSSWILYFDPATMQVQRKIQVLLNDEEVRNVNELEYINGELLANVWFTNNVLRIDPNTGRVKEVLNLDHLRNLEHHAKTMRGPLKRDAVMNGIAYNPENRHVYVTGKLWDSMFELDLNVPRHHIRRRSQP